MSRARSRPVVAATRLVNGILRRAVEIEARPVDVPRRRHERFLPRSVWRRAIKLEYGVYDEGSGTLHVVHDYGLFSCLSVTLWSLADLFRDGHVPRRLNLDRTLGAFRDPGRDTTGSVLFTTDVDPVGLDRLKEMQPSRLVRFDHHGDYGQFDFEVLTALRETYLAVSPAVLERAAELEREFLVAGARYGAVCIRGTDKAREVIPLDSALYVEAARSLLDEGAVDRILIQTDQAQIARLFEREFAGRCDRFTVLPVTETLQGIHLSTAVDGRRLEFARDMVAAVMVIAGMPRVITHTGNVGAWTTLFRGSGEGVIQATPRGFVSLDA
ncbi:MAG: hypothetical protein RIE08_07895 [Acidimicrobiales bacterium]